MKKIILSTVDLNIQDEDVSIIRVTEKSINKYNGNPQVIAVVGSRSLSKKVITLSLPGLRMFQLTSAGYDGVPVNEFKVHNVAVCNAGSVYSQPIAETVVYGMLQFAKRYWQNPKHHFFRPWRKYRYITELANKRAIILGCGNIGTAVARRLQGFEMIVDGFDPYCASKPEFGTVFMNRRDLLAALPVYHYVITTLPDTEETRGSLNSEFFQVLNKEAVIVNVGRKAIFNQRDFLEALKTHRIAGAVLDMFEKFPNPFMNPFRRLSNVIVLPGVAAISQEVNARLKKHIEDNCTLVINEQTPKFRID